VNRLPILANQMPAVGRPDLLAIRNLGGPSRRSLLRQGYELGVSDRRDGALEGMDQDVGVKIQHPTEGPWSGDLRGLGSWPRDSQ
jgi:hypothetical protein